MVGKYYWTVTKTLWCDGDLVPQIIWYPKVPNTQWNDTMEGTISPGSMFITTIATSHGGVRKCHNSVRIKASVKKTRDSIDKLVNIMHCCPIRICLLLHPYLGLRILHWSFSGLDQGTVSLLYWNQHCSILQYSSDTAPLPKAFNVRSHAYKRMHKARMSIVL